MMIKGLSIGLGVQKSFKEEEGEGEGDEESINISTFILKHFSFPHSVIDRFIHLCL
jgi:hypothetical protein